MDQDALPILAELTAAYMERFARRSKDFLVDAKAIEDLRALRTAIRKDEGGGGMCHLVTDHLFGSHSLERMWVSYLDRSGEVICAAHMVSILRDGSILDATADQFGEGHDVRLLRPDDPEYGRYRPEFIDDFNPGHEDGDSVAGWAPYWSGKSDDDRQDEIRAERGEGWWVEDKAALREYLTDQLSLSDDEYEGFMRARLEALDAGTSVPSL